MLRQMDVAYLLLYMYVSVLKSVWELHIISKLVPLLSELNKQLKRVYDSHIHNNNYEKYCVSQFFTITVLIFDD